MEEQIAQMIEQRRRNVSGELVKAGRTMRAVAEKMQISERQVWRLLEHARIDDRLRGALEGVLGSDVARVALTMGPRR